jgi:hypothetical protein
MALLLKETLHKALTDKIHKKLELENIALSFQKQSMEWVDPLKPLDVLPMQVTDILVSSWTGQVREIVLDGQILSILTGSGVCIFKNGNRYKGRFEMGFMEGQGTLTFPNGITYTGDFKQNKMEGQGAYKWLDGSTYEGQVEAGLRHGHGTYTNPNEGIVYTGLWVKGKRHGKGKLTYRDGTVFEGNWQEGYKEGNGRMTYPSGNFYEGSFTKNRREGHGVMNWVTQNEKYEGDWVNDAQNGFGVHIWLGRESKRLIRNRYVGFWKDGKRHGKGIFYFTNGSYYQGDWCQN